MRQEGSIYRKWKNLVQGSGLIVALILLASIGFVQSTTNHYHENRRRMMQLDNFYKALDELDNDVYSYTLTGDETLYDQICEEIAAEREILAELARRYEGTRLYREIRDLEEMFYSYVQCLNRIYDHAYLCNVMTVASKRVINQYYEVTTSIYEAMASEFEGMYSSVLSASENTQRMIERRNQILMADLILMLLLSAAFLVERMRKLFRNIVIPVQQLTEKVGAVDVALETGQDTMEEVEETPDMDAEIQGLIRVYNGMIRRIALQVREIRENASAKEKLKNQELENLRISNLLKSSELQALQMQINPHYLFNTMNMISQTAFLEGAEQTKQLLDTAASLFRYTLDYAGRTVTLAREMENLGSYVELQEQRFGERITFDFRLDESFHQIQMPAMLLQPLVENALIHGVGMKTENARIVISTFRREADGWGVIRIEDNGEGMDRQQLSAVVLGMHREEILTQRIGLGNVYQRLKIFFGDEADMCLESTPGRGTRVDILIRLKEQEEA